MKAVSKDLLNAVLEHPGLRRVRVQCMDEQRRFGRRKVKGKRGGMEGKNERISIDMSIGTNYR